MVRPRKELDVVQTFRGPRILTLEQLSHKTRSSRSTVIRRLDEHGYHSSYNHSGKFLTIDEVAEFDSQGLWIWKTARFSKHGNLKETVWNFVEDSKQGMTHQELAALLGVRVHNSLLELVEEEWTRRERLGPTFVYLSHKGSVRREQVRRRKTLLAEAVKPRPTARQIIAALLELIKDPRAPRHQIVLRCQRSGVSISHELVDAIFGTYDLDKKKGSIAVYELLRQERKKATTLCQERGLAVPQFTFSWEEEGCRKCSQPLQVRLTRRRTVFTVLYGKFVAIERQGYCPNHPDLPPAHSTKLSRIVAPGCNMGHDLIARVGLARFLECRQCEEIQTELSHHPGIEVPLRTISELSQKFIAYFQAVHQESIKLLRREMRNRGGYILHIDGTCEEGSRVLLVCLDSLSGQVLESRKISSENVEEVEQVLRNIRRDWGCPLAVVHDLRKSLITAPAKVFPGVRQFVCHYHFAADVGKDILSCHVDRLRKLFRRTKVKPKLRALCRSLKKFAVAKDNGDHVLNAILGVRSIKTLRNLSTPESVKGTVHALASWILAFSHNGDGYGFPFDLRYLTLYDRILDVDKVLREVGAIYSLERRGPLGTLRRLKDILDIVVASEHTAEFRTIVTETKRDQRIFERLRNALRICPKGGTQRRNDDGVSNLLSASSHKTLLKDLRRSLKRKARRGTSPKACNIVVEHLDKYWDYLFGHVLKTGSKKIVVPRTNNVEESLFRTIKRQCRRLHGRGHVCRDIDDMLEGAPLVLNLRNAGYCEIVYGSVDVQRIADRFSQIDPSIPAQLLKKWRRDKLLVRLPRKLERLTRLPQRLARFIGVAFKELQK